jgi:hypothetical protein
MLWRITGKCGKQFTDPEDYGDHLPYCPLCREGRRYRRMSRRWSL